MPLSTICHPKIPVLARLEGNCIEFALPVQVFAHLTAPWRISEMRMLGLFLAWIRSLQAYHRVTLGWVCSIERHPSPHIHTAIIAATPLDCAHAATLWRGMVAPRYSDAAKVKPYRRGICGLAYILKELNTAAEEIQFSDNIAAFVDTGKESLFQTSGPQLRQQRRIREQLRRASQRKEGNFAERVGAVSESR